MAIGSKQKYTEEYNAEHFEESYNAKVGAPIEKAEQSSWAAANDRLGGSERTDSGIIKSDLEPEAMNENLTENFAENRKERAEPYALEKQSISALRSKARKKRIFGRSNMSRVELIMALRKAR